MGRGQGPHLHEQDFEAGKSNPHALFFSSASKGQKNLYSGGGLCSGSIAKESIGLFKIGAKLFEAGGAYGAYQLLKKVFDEPDEPKKG